MGGDKPCYICARMRRGSLYDKAKSLGANKLAQKYTDSKIF